MSLISGHRNQESGSPSLSTCSKGRTTLLGMSCTSSSDPCPVWDQSRAPRRPFRALPSLSSSVFYSPRSTGQLAPPSWSKSASPGPGFGALERDLEAACSSPASRPPGCHAELRPVKLEFSPSPPQPPFLPLPLSLCFLLQLSARLCVFPGNDSHICLPPALPASQTFIQKGPSVSTFPRSEVSGEVRVANRHAPCRQGCSPRSLRSGSLAAGLALRISDSPQASGENPIPPSDSKEPFDSGLAPLPFWAPCPHAQEAPEAELGDLWPFGITPRVSCFLLHPLSN